MSMSTSLRALLSRQQLACHRTSSSAAMTVRLEPGSGRGSLVVSSHSWMPPGEAGESQVYLLPCASRGGLRAQRQSRPRPWPMNSTALTRTSKTPRTPRPIAVSELGELSEDEWSAMR